MQILLVVESDPISYDAQWPDSSTSFPNFYLPPQSAHLFEDDNLS
jgi:hypothetical protein